MRSHPETANSAEWRRLREASERTVNWKRWGPYLAERQWGTVREDYSEDGESWHDFPHEHARSRAYRWGEDGLLGITDRQCRLCFSLALWNGKDPILKERLFGLTGPEGNHGEDVKECYYYLDSTPTHSYMKALYKYPQNEYPYAGLVEENARRSRTVPEFELLDTGAFAENRYFDVFAEYAKASANDLLIRITAWNRGPDAAPLDLLPTLWFRNTWSWGCIHEGCEIKPRLTKGGDRHVIAEHATLGRFHWHIETVANAPAPLLFTENETNARRVFGERDSLAGLKAQPVKGKYFKDSFHRYVIDRQTDTVNPQSVGTKAAAHFAFDVPPGESVELCLRLHSDSEAPAELFGRSFKETFGVRKAEADEFYAACLPEKLSGTERELGRQAYAGLAWTKQFYHYAVREWLEGDPDQPAPPPARRQGRNSDWLHLFNRDIISMPDKWEYPWYAAWDLAFHMIPFAKFDPDFAKEQLVLFLREWYMHPNGQIPAYEFALGDVNPPVHAWACWRVYKMANRHGERDREFLARVFHKLMLNFTWWVNRKDHDGNHVFAGGFLGLDNIGVFDRSKPFPTGGRLEQADATAWMAFYCSTLLAMALELASVNPEYEDVASKFFEHFVAIVDAMNTLDGTGLWDEEDGFYYDKLHVGGVSIALRTRSLVGIVAVLAVEVLEDEVIDKLPGFRKRMDWFLTHRQDLARHVSCMEPSGEEGERRGLRLLAVPSRQRLERVLRYVFDEKEFLSPHGVRSLSKIHEKEPYAFRSDHQEYSIGYLPGESDSGFFGGNSNWRGPVWMPINYLLVEALERYHRFYGDSLQVEFPTGSGRKCDLGQAARELSKRLVSLFLEGEDGRRPCHGEDTLYSTNPHWKDLVLFYEYFHGDTGRGLGASHQTGWTALVAKLLEKRG